MEALRAQALCGWLAAIGQSGWRKATVEAAAAASGLSTDDILKHLGDRFDALAAFQEKVAGEAAKGAAGGGSVRERLFDAMMQGFDELQANRAAVLALRSSRDPGIAALVAGRAGLHIRRLALACGMNVSGARGRMRLAALALLAVKALESWRKDESADMSATMAELDRLLERAERAELEGLSPDLLGLPGITALFDRLRFRPAPLNGEMRGARAGPALPPSPGPSVE